MTWSTNGPHISARFDGEEILPQKNVNATLGVEQYIIYAAVFLSPFLNLRNDALFFTLSDGLYCIAFAVLLIRGRLPRSPLGIVTIIWFTSYLLVVGGLYFSSLLFADLQRGGILVIQYSFCFIVLPLVLLRSDETEAYRLIHIFLFGVLALDLHGIVTFHTVGYDETSRTVTGGLRLATLNGNANGAACLNAMSLVIVLWLSAAGRLSRVLAFCCLSIISYTIVLTSSNTGLIAVTVGVAIYLCWTLQPRLLFKVVAVIGLIALFLRLGGLDYLPATFQKRVFAAVVSGDVDEAGTFVSRKALMIEALEMIDARGPMNLLGMGADQFRVYSVQRIPVHNSFLILWAEGGLISLIGWLVLTFMGLILWLLALGRRVAYHSRAAGFACFAVFVVVANGSPHIYARTWYTALLLVMQPTIIQLSRGRGTSRTMTATNRGGGQAARRPVSFPTQR